MGDALLCVIAWIDVGWGLCVACLRDAVARGSGWHGTAPSACTVLFMVSPLRGGLCVWALIFFGGG